jgi:tetratricopeptide (TPR) repeat protein
VSALLAALLVISACGPRTAEEYYQQGLRYFRDKEYARALVAFRNAAAKDRNDHRAQYHLGVSAMETGDTATARRALSMAEQLDKGQSEFSADTRIRMGLLILSERDYDQVRLRAQWVLARDKSNPKALELMGFALAGLAEIEPAKNTLDQLVLQQPGNLQARVLRATLHLAEEQRAEALQTLEQAVAATDRHPAALTALANLKHILGDQNQAIALYEEAVRANPKDIKSRLSLAWLRIRLGQRADGERMLRELVQERPEDLRVATMLPTLYMLGGEPAKAIPLLEALSGKYPKKKLQPGVWHALALAYYLAGRRADAERTLQALLQEDSQFAEGRLLYGMLHLQAGRAKEAIGEFTHVVNQRSDSPVVLFLLALANAADNNGQLAEQQAKKAMDIDPSFLAARTWLVERFLHAGAAAPALAHVREAPPFLRTVPELQVLAAIALVISGQERAAAQEIQSVLKAQPKLLFRYYQKGFASQLSRLETIMPAMEGGLRNEPASIEYLGVLAVTMQLRGQATRAAARVEAQSRHAPASAAHLHLLADAQKKAGRSEAARATLAQLAKLRPNSPMPLLEGAQVELAAGDREAARKRLEELVKLQPNSSEAWSQLAQVYEMQGHMTLATSAYERAVALDKNNLVAANNLAWRLVEDGGDLTRALILAQTARAANPHNADFADTLGWIYFRMGSVTEAEKQLKDALRLQPNSASFRQHLEEIRKKLR